MAVDFGAGNKVGGAKLCTLSPTAALNPHTLTHNAAVAVALVFGASDEVGGAKGDRLLTEPGILKVALGSHGDVGTACLIEAPCAAAEADGARLRGTAATGVSVVWNG